MSGYPDWDVNPNYDQRDWVEVYEWDKPGGVYGENGIRIITSKHRITGQIGACRNATQAELQHLGLAPLLRPASGQGQLRFNGEQLYNRFKLNALDTPALRIVSSDAWRALSPLRKAFWEKLAQDLHLM